jgi:hypothetical protein
MKPTLTLLAAVLLAPLAAPAQQTSTLPTVNPVGDGIHDDTAAIQALLDSRRALVYLPAPPKHYLISQPLRIHSNQTLQLDHFTVIRLKDGSDCVMITNDDHERGNENIALVGGVWDMHNEGQSLAEYQKTRTWKYLSLSQVNMDASEGPARGGVVRNSGKIGSLSFQQVSVVNAAMEMPEGAAQ